MTRARALLVALGITGGVGFACSSGSSGSSSGVAGASDAGPTDGALDTSTDDVASDAPVSACEIPPSAPQRVGVVTLREGLRCTRYPFPLEAPRDLVEATDGTIYVTELKGGRVSRLTATGFSPVATGLNTPIGIAEAPDGSLFVGQEGGKSISRLDPKSGALTAVATDLGAVTGLTLGPDGSLYASTFPAFTLPPTPGAIVRFALGGDGGAVTRTDFATGVFVPEGLLFDAATGRLLVAEAYGAAGPPGRVVRLAVGGGDATKGETVASASDHSFGLARAPSGGLFYGEVFDTGDGQKDGVMERACDGTVRVVARGIAAPVGMTTAKNGDLLVLESVVTNASTGYLVRISGF